MRLLKLCSLNLLIFLITCTKYSTISCGMEVGYHNPTVVASMGTKFDAVIVSRSYCFQPSILDQRLILFNCVKIDR
jgi:hypothetical protein